MTNRQRSNSRIVVSGIVVHFTNGQYVQLDTSKVQVIDRQTGKPLFDEVLDAQPEVKSASADHRTPNEADTVPPEVLERAAKALIYEEAFDTPHGRMVFAKNGDWSGVRPARAGE